MARPIAYRERDDPTGGGIYCFYPFDSPLDETCKGIFKIGLAIDFHDRIGNYHTYLPMGVYKMAILQDPKKGSGYFETLKMYYLKIEKQIYDDIVKDGGYPIFMAIRKQNLGRTEWIYTDQKTIHKAFERAIKVFGAVPETETKTYSRNIDRYIISDFTCPFVSNFSHSNCGNCSRLLSPLRFQKKSL